MRDIASEFDTIEKTKYQIGGPTFFSRSHKKTREWQVLGVTQNILREQGFDYPVYAKEQEKPDFIAYRDDGSIWSRIEIVEILVPGYKRQDYHKKLAQRKHPHFFGRIKPLTEPFAPLREQIAKKSLKPYARDSTLIVYYDIGRLHIEDAHLPFEKLISDEHNRQPLDHINTFRRVLVLNASLDALLEIYPAWIVIKPDVNGA